MSNPVDNTAASSVANTNTSALPPDRAGSFGNGVDSPDNSGTSPSSTSSADCVDGSVTNTLTTTAGSSSASASATPLSSQIRSTGPRKNSAERNVVHTRMEDDDVQKEYEYGEILGEGSFGKVYRAKHLQNGETVAIKEIVKEKAGSSGLKQLDKEVTIFKKVDHKNIIKLKEVIESPKKMYLIMELCEGGDVAKLLTRRGNLTEGDTKVIMRNLAQAIKYLHQQGILHRDLKLENLLLAEDPDETRHIVIKVSDFGLSTIQNNNSYENMQEQYCGTPSYMAPEMNSTYSYPVDVWAMGIIMYYLLTRYPKDNELNDSIATNGPKFEEPQWKDVSDQAKDLLREILVINPAYRPSSGEVLNHEWFTGKKREHGNVLELMKDFRREHKEQTEGQGPSSDGEGVDSTGAINGLSSQSSSSGRANTIATETVSKKEPRKGSGGKKSSGDASLKVPQTSGAPKSSVNKVKASSGALTPSPRPPSKTPTPKMSHETSGSRLSAAATKTVTPKATNNANGPAISKAAAPAASSRITSTAQKVKRK